MPASLRLKAYKTLQRYGDGRCTPRTVELPFGLYVKYGHASEVTISEALVTQHVSLHTNIPVPIILDVLSDSDGDMYIIMTCLPGREVARMPRNLDEYSALEMDTFVATIGVWLGQLRTLEPSPYGDTVCGFTGGSFQSFRIDHNRTVGPFASQEEFYSQRYNRLPDEADADIRVLGARLRSQKRYRIYLTHGDISPNNILVDDHYKPVGLVDWGCAAWMPEYWELTYALYRRQRYSGWVKAFTQVFPQYQDEVTVETEQWKYICPW